MSQVKTNISSSEASIKQYASENFASISLDAVVNGTYNDRGQLIQNGLKQQVSGIGSHLKLTSYSAYMYYDTHTSTDGGYIGLSATATTIGSTSVSTTIYGKQINLNGPVYLPSTYSGSTYLGSKKISHMNITTKDDDYIDVLYLVN